MLECSVKELWRNYSYLGFVDIKKNYICPWQVKTWQVLHLFCNTRKLQSWSSAHSCPSFYQRCNNLCFPLAFCNFSYKDRNWILIDIHFLSKTAIKLMSGTHHQELLTFYEPFHCSDSFISFSCWNTQNHKIALLQITASMKSFFCFVFFTTGVMWAAIRWPGYKGKNAEQKMSAELLTENASLGTRNSPEKCSWVPRNQRHPAVLSICTKQGTVTALYCLEACKSLAKGENILREQELTNAIGCSSWKNR